MVEQVQGPAEAGLDEPWPCLASALPAREEAGLLALACAARPCLKPLAIGGTGVLQGPAVPCTAPHGPALRARQGRITAHESLSSAATSSPSWLYSASPVRPCWLARGPAPPRRTGPGHRGTGTRGCQLGRLARRGGPAWARPASAAPSAEVARWRCGGVMRGGAAGRPWAQAGLGVSPLPLRGEPCAPSWPGPARPAPHLEP